MRIPTLMTAAGIIVLDQRFRSNQSPCTLYEARQLTRFNGREANQNPRIIPVVVRYEERGRCGLHQNLAIEKVRPKHEAVNALMQPGEQLAANFERRGPV